MKKILVSFLVVMAGLLAFNPVVYGYFDINVGDAFKWAYPAVHGTTSGGLFKITNLDHGNTFYTFCIEVNEHITSGVTYYAGGINKYAVLGGDGGSVGGKDDLSLESAYLYYHYRLGDLSSLTGNVYQNNSAGYDSLQLALWYLEEESLGSTNYLVTLANNASAADKAIALYHVSVINVVDIDKNNKQDLLCLVPEPASLLLLGIGLLGMGVLARRKS